MIGIICAMEVEIEELSSIMKDRREETVSGIKFITGTLSGRKTVMAVCGVGKVFAAMCAEIMILKYNADLILNQGVAGTLTDKLNVFDVAVAKSLVQHDMDTSAVGDEVGLISGINVINLPCDKKMVDTAVSVIEKLGINTLTGVVASGDQFIASNEKKKEIAQRFNAIACEMEGGAIAQVCYVNKVPFLVIRAISDSADSGATVDYPEFIKKAASNSAKIAAEFVKVINI